MIYATILGAGADARNDKNLIPVQFTMLGNKPIIIHTLEQFVVSSSIDKILVVVNNEWIVYTKDLICKWINTNKEIIVICGGENKNHSIFLATKYISDNFSINEDDVIVNHDAIRPFITQRIIYENVEKAKINMVVNTIMPTVDTIVISSDQKKITDIPAKSKMYSEQTPQSFNLKLLYDTYSSEEESVILREIDTTRFMIKKNHDVYCVIGEYSNIKIKTLFDLEVANAFIRR